MPLVSRAADIYYTYRFIKVLTTPWEKMDAYKLGLVDGNGKKLKSPKTSEEKDSYSLFFRLAFNFKRTLEKLPFGKQRLSSYAAALYLLRENSELSEDDILNILDKTNTKYNKDILEEKFYINENGSISPGIYVLEQDISSPETGDSIARLGTRVSIAEGTLPVSKIFGESIYAVRHIPTKQTIYISAGDIRRWNQVNMS